MNPFQHPPASHQAGVVINGQPMTPDRLAQVGVQPGQIPAGHYWYDAMSGFWGCIGGGALGQTMPNLPLGAMPPNASGSGTGVWVNGREVTAQEVQWLTDAVGAPIPPGRYFLDAMGNAGVEGGPIQINVFQSSQQRARYISHDGMLTRGGGFYDPSSGDHYYSFTDSSGKTYSSGT